MKALDQRARTIVKVATEIVIQQEGFFRHGVSQLKPLTLRAVAETIGMHESTVSRVTSNKYLSCDRGLYELKYFFTSGIQSNDGGDAASSEAVKSRIKALIARRGRRTRSSPTTSSSRCSRPRASTSPAARSPNIARRSGLGRRCSGGGRRRSGGRPEAARDHADVRGPASVGGAGRACLGRYRDCAGRAAAVANRDATRRPPPPHPPRLLRRPRSAPARRPGQCRPPAPVAACMAERMVDRLSLAQLSRIGDLPRASSSVSVEQVPASHPLARRCADSRGQLELGGVVRGGDGLRLAPLPRRLSRLAVGMIVSHVERRMRPRSSAHDGRTASARADPHHVRHRVAGFSGQRHDFRASLAVDSLPLCFRRGP